MAFNTYVRRANRPFDPDDLTRFLNEDFAKVPESTFSSSVSDGAVLVYDASSGLWMDGVVSLTIDELTDVTVASGVADGDVLTYDASSDTWVSETLSLTTTLDSLTDTAISTAPTDGHVLTYDASSDTWVDAEAAGGVTEEQLETVDLNAQTGTTYTLALSDRGQVVTMDNASANTVTIPTNASVAFDTGTVISVLQKGAGTTSIAGDTGVTLNGVSAGSGDMDAQYDVVSLVKVATDEWIASGSIGTVA